MTNAIVPYADMERMAVTMVKSRMFGIDTPEQAISLMLIAQAEGKHPAIIARDFHIIQGRGAKKSEAMLRDFMAAGGRVEWHKLDDTIADATFTHPQGGSVRITWDMERGTKAGLAGRDMWKKYPRQMLRSRCVSEGIRTVAPLATSGVYTPEEVVDMTPEVVTVEPAPAPERMSDEEAGELQHAIATAPDLDTLRQVYATAYSKAKRDGNHGALLMFEATKDARKQALQEAA